MSDLTIKLRIDGDHETLLADFVACNEGDISYGDICRLRELAIGETAELIGGAFADMTIERIS